MQFLQHITVLRSDNLIQVLLLSLRYCSSCMILIIPGAARYSLYYPRIGPELVSDLAPCYCICFELRLGVHQNENYIEVTPLPSSFNRVIIF